MTLKNVLAKRALLLLVIISSLFSRASALAQSVSLTWDPSPTPTVAGYEIFYGLASGDYAWSVDAGSNASWTLSGLTSGIVYYIAVLAYDAYGDISSFSDEVIDGTPTVPQIATQPAGQSVAAGATVSLAVTASGAAPLTYQWFDGAAALPGATNAVLTLSNLSIASAGNYSAVIANSYGSVTSSVAALAVLNLPVITTQPVDQTVLSGELASFNVSVQGTGPFTCQWLFNGSSLASGAGLTNIAVTASPANLGYYCVVIANSNGSVMSSLAALAVISPPVITIQPVSQSAAAGATVCFNISATGTAPLAYQWFDGAAALPGATNEMLTLSDISEANAGNYNVVISNSAGSVTSSLVTLSILNPPVITSQPVPQTVPLGSIALFNVSVQGTGPFTYQWMHNGTAVSSGGQNYLLVMASTANLGNYSVAVANSSGSVTSSAAPLQTPNPPTPAMTRLGNSIVLSWPSSATGCTLQQNSNLATTNWIASKYAITTNGATASITIPSAAGNMFFRLCNP